jgi:hypothetical protein
MQLGLDVSLALATAWRSMVCTNTIRDSLFLASRCMEACTPCATRTGRPAILGRSAQRALYTLYSLNTRGYVSDLRVTDHLLNTHVCIRGEKANGRGVCITCVGQYGARFVLCAEAKYCQEIRYIRKSQAAATRVDPRACFVNDLQPTGGQEAGTIAPPGQVSFRARSVYASVVLLQLTDVMLRDINDTIVRSWEGT